MDLLKDARFGSMKGQAMAEFAIVASLFFLLLFAAIDYGWLMFAQMNVQQAVQDGGRYASTGNHLPNPSDPNQNLSRIQSIIDTIQSEVNVPGVNAQNLQVSSVSSATGVTTNGSPGGPGDTVTVTLVTSLPVLTPMVASLFSGGVYTFTSSASFKNEPFDPSQTN